MVKSLEQDVENYVASIPGAMQNYKNYLVRKRNFHGKYLAEKSLDYGINMLHSGLGENVTPKVAESIFREQAIICNVLADHCKELSNN